MELKQGTVQLVIIIGIIVIAAGAWSTPMLVAYTSHLTDQQIAAAKNAIIKNTDLETGELDDIIGQAGDLDEAGCDLVELIVAHILEQDVDIVCDKDKLSENIIQGEADYQALKNVFEFEESFLFVRPGVLLPINACDDTTTPPNDVIADAGGGSRFAGIGIPDDAGDGAGVLGVATCFAPLLPEDAPRLVKSITIENPTAAKDDVRIQIGISPDGDSSANTLNCQTAGADDFDENILFDTLVEVPGTSKVTISGDFMIVFPPDDQHNICIRLASDDGDTGGAQNYPMWISVVEEIPLDVFSFLPPPEFQNFIFETHAPLDFTTTCGIEITVKDQAGNLLQNIPVQILEPVISGVDQNETTGADGKVLFGEGLAVDVDDADGTADDEELPSTFYVIDVNNQADGATDPDTDFAPFFPDGPRDCRLLANGGDADGGAQIPITVVLQKFVAKTIRVSVFDGTTGDLVQGASVSASGTLFDGTAAPAVNFTDTDSDGETQVSVSDGFYTIIVDKGSKSGGASTVVDFGSPLFVDIFIVIN